MTARAVFSEARLLKLLALAREQGLQPSTVRLYAGRARQRRHAAQVKELRE